MKYITKEDWDEFRNNYEGAYQFLLERNLKGEIKCLLSELKTGIDDNRRWNWVFGRLYDLYMTLPEYFEGTGFGSENLVEMLKEQTKRMEA